jgi:hypothetical protein
MGRISQYPLDTDIQGNDKWIGTSVSNANATKNFSVDTVAEYLNKSAALDSQNLRYTYQNVQGDDVRLASTISFMPSLGDNVSFDDITEWVISAYSKQVKDVRTYYEAPLIGNTILITNAFNPSNWAIFRWDSVTEDLEDENFYHIGLTHIQSSGGLQVNQDYLIALLDASSSGATVWGDIIGTLSDQTDLQDALDAKQDELVSGTNIKTINSTSLLGSGDIVINTPPSGVAGAIQFSNGSAFSSDASNFFWDNTNKRLGIGTNTPISDVNIVRNINNTFAGVTLQNTSNGTAANTVFRALDNSTGVCEFGLGGTNSLGLINTAYFYTNKGILSFFANALERMRINASGNVGIGETSPTARLQVKGSGSTSGTFALIVQNSSGTELMNLDNGGTLNFANPTNIDAINISGFGRMKLRKIYGGDYPSNFLALDGFSITYNGGYSNGGHIFNVNSAEAVRISSNKNLLIGTTTDIASSKLTVDSTTQGALLPRMTTTQRNAIVSPATGLIVYDTTLLAFYQYNGTAWVVVGGGSPSGVAGAIQFSDGSAFASDASNFFWDDTNNRLGIGINVPTTKLHTKGTGTTSATQSFKAENSTAAKYMQFGDDGQLGINISPTSTVHIKGSGGVDHLTSSLRVENSGNSASFTLRDDGSFILLGNTVARGQNAPLLAMRDGYHELFIGGSGFSSAGYITQNFCFSGSMSTTRFQGLQIENGSTSGSLNATSGAYKALDIIGSRFGNTLYAQFNPTSGTATYTHINLNTGINQTGTASGAVYGINYNPDITSILGAHYGILMRPTNMKNGFGLGATLPTATVHIKGSGTTTSTKSLQIENNNSTKQVLFDDAGNLMTNGSMAIGQTTPPSSTSILELVSTTQGFLPPRMTNAQILAIATPANGLMVYNTTIDHLCVYQAGAWAKLNHSPM